MLIIKNETNNVTVGRLRVKQIGTTLYSSFIIMPRQMSQLITVAFKYPYLCNSIGIYNTEAAA